MDIVYFIAILFGSYLALVFLGLRLVAPFMGFKQHPPAKDLPEEARRVVTELESKSLDQLSYLQAVYGFVLGRWQHTRLQALLQLPKLFIKDFGEIWHAKGFVYCTSINYVVYSLLSNSRFFTPGDIKTRHVFLNFVPHQYLQVRVGGRWVDVDPAGAGIRGRPLGAHASFFG